MVLEDLPKQKQPNLRDQPQQGGIWRKHNVIKTSDALTGYRTYGTENTFLCAANTLEPLLLLRIDRAGSEQALC